MERIGSRIERRGWLRSWQLWLLGIIFATCIYAFYPVKFGSIVLLLTRFFLLAAAGYVCTRIFFPVRYHDLAPDDATRRKRALGVYIYLAGCAVGAGAGAIG
jgi:hypothetical protein